MRATATLAEAAVVATKRDPLGKFVINLPVYKVSGSVIGVRSQVTRCSFMNGSFEIIIMKTDSR